MMKKILVSTFHEVGDSYRWFGENYTIKKITDAYNGASFLHLEKI